jgi:hypothetical protein
MGRPVAYINLEEAGNSCTEAAVKEHLNLGVGLLHSFVCSCTPVHKMTVLSFFFFFDQMIYCELSASFIVFSVTCKLYYVLIYSIVAICNV